MKIKYFREFLVLAKYLNFSLAANNLNMTQPGLSRHISALEKEIGVKLLERDTHRVTLTDKGKQFFKGIEKIIDDYDSLCEAVQAERLEKLTIGVPYFGVNRYLNNIIRSFETAYPEIKIDYLPAYPDKIISELFAKRVDVAVLPKAQFRGFEELVFHKAFSEPLVLLLHKKHPLAEKHGIRIADLKDEIMIFLKGNFGEALHAEACELCRQRKLPVSRHSLQKKTIEEAALSMNPEGRVMILPGHLQEANISDDVTCIDILDENLSLSINLVRHPQNQNPTVDVFINFYLKTILNSAE